MGLTGVRNRSQRSGSKLESSGHYLRILGRQHLITRPTNNKNICSDRYCYLIFWWVEAVCASRSEDNDRSQEAISRAREPSPTELYLFLQSFLHAAPHAIVNILALMTRYSDMTFDKGKNFNFGVKYYFRKTLIHLLFTIIINGSFPFIAS